MISVIIPIYNQEDNLNQCIKSLKRQTLSFNELEVILVNDGSSDASDDICRKISKRYKNVKYICQENQGVSAARNAGLKEASGKYIFFLDADDCLEKHTISNIVKFFDSVYDEVDLVTYPIETVYNKKVLKPHFRYRYLKNSGVYDLNENPYIGQTTMNIVVKNRFENNVLFDVHQTFSEDQRYCCDVLHDKLKMGFCKDGKYIYYRSSNSSSGKLSGACYIFEQCMDFFEQMFAKYEKVPKAFQGLYVNDIYWKMVSNILFPYHYDKALFDESVKRIKRLLKRCDNEVILEHPQMDYFEKFYLLRLKDKNSLQCRLTNTAFSLVQGDKLITHEKSMEIVITKLRAENGKIEILGFVKSVFLQFYQQEVVVCAVENGGELTRKLQIYDSAHNFYQSREKTQRFKAFRYSCDVGKVKNVRFEVGFNGYWFPTHYYFMPHIPFSHKLKKYQCIKNNIEIKVNGHNEFLIDAYPVKGRKRIWLYYDCVGVRKDNGYLQFVHDVQKNDGIERYYIVTDKRQKEDSRYKKCYVEFGSKRHKQLLCQCEKILTAYIEESNIFPYNRNEIEKNADKMDFQVIYLQHGVLHIVMPWKFSPEKILADKVVVSTSEEKKLFISNGFSLEDILETGMARFEALNKAAKKKKKILYAPSWRNYLVGEYKNHRWKMLEEKFVKSKFFIENQRLINNKDLEQCLEKYDYTMDIKLHPIFSMYQKNFTTASSRIRFISENIKEEEYSLFITDFSSYAYNFIYLGTSVINFIPDIIEFKCGMNGYRDLNYPEEFWDKVALVSEDAVKQISNFIVYGEKNESYTHFLDVKNSAEHLYQIMAGKIENE